MAYILPYPRPVRYPAPLHRPAPGWLPMAMAEQALRMHAQALDAYRREARELRRAMERAAPAHRAVTPIISEIHARKADAALRRLGVVTEAWK